MKDKELKNMPLFAEIGEDTLKTLFSTHQIVESSYHKSATVHPRGELCSTVDIVLSGKLIAYSLAQNGSESMVFEFISGDIIGANLLFGNNNRYPLNIYCATDCDLLHITKEAVSQLLHDYNFTMQYIKSLSRNSQGMNLKLAMFTQKSLKENILDYLVALSAEQHSDTVTLPLSKKQLADYFGVQRPSLFRELKRLSDEKCIVINNRVIEIHRDKHLP